MSVSLRMRVNHRDGSIFPRYRSHSIRPIIKIIASRFSSPPWVSIFSRWFVIAILWLFLPLMHSTTVIRIFFSMHWPHRETSIQLIWIWWTRTIFITWSNVPQPSLLNFGHSFSNIWFYRVQSYTPKNSSSGWKWEKILVFVSCTTKCWNNEELSLWNNAVDCVSNKRSISILSI